MAELSNVEFLKAIVYPRLMIALVAKYAYDVLQIFYAVPVFRLPFLWIYGGELDVSTETCDRELRTSDDPNPPVVYTTLLISNQLKLVDAKALGNLVDGHTQSMESHVGSHTLQSSRGSESGMWNELPIDNTYGRTDVCSERRVLNAPYMPSLM
ncbi:hypothetical protein B0H17DRAFT_1195508 [Mycena rosella]|uniref:Uncharacterized protein n=1 Tax=Mycena rosella TaxID=1033263 RepID=A0AAD7GM76_MYCRO|nr:hypothetical protein B0H17DRAFT_1195508 [Mycena rosella]